MLYDAVKTLLAVLYGRASERVESVVDTIDEDANAPEKLSRVKPSGVERPNVQAQCVGVLNVQGVFGNPEHNLTAAIMLNGVFCGATATEYTFVGWPMSPLHSPVCAPPVKQGMNDRCLDTRWDKLGESEESPMNANAVSPWLSAEAIGDVAPTVQFMTDPLNGYRALGRFDGFDSRPLELLFDFDDIVFFQIIGRFIHYGAVNAECMDANAAQLAEVISENLTMIALIPRVVLDDSVQVDGITHAAMKLVHSGKDIVLGQSSQVTCLNVFTLKVAAQCGNTKLGCFHESLKGLC